jgi:hypothetical protein
VLATHRARKLVLVDGQTFEASRVEYLQEVITALSTYVNARGGVRLESSRSDDELAITFTLTEAEHYQKLLARLTDSDAAGPQADHVSP